nr:MAG TPA: hypothetical protein [Caudoviricetes sp.]
MMINPDDVEKISGNDPTLKELKEELVKGGKEKGENGRQSVG